MKLAVACYGMFTDFTLQVLSFNMGQINFAWGGCVVFFFCLHAVDLRHINLFYVLQMLFCLIPGSQKVPTSQKN
jgi:hypothetical protein